MAETTRDLPDGYEQYATFSIHTNPLNRRVSYILHFASVIFFVPLFAAVTAAVRPGEVLDPIDLWAVSIPRLGVIGAVAVLFFIVAGVMNLHQLIHAGVIRYNAGAVPTITPRRITFGVSTPGFYLPKRRMMLVTVAPFFVLSAIGALLLSLVPASGIAWIFIPLVANGIASSRDILTLSWTIATPAGSLFHDAGTELTVYAERG